MICRRDGRPSGRTFELRFETGAIYHPGLEFPLYRMVIEPSTSAVGRIFLGPVHAPFEADLGCWATTDYEAEWRRAASRLVDGPGAALFTTSYRGPAARNHAAWLAERQGDVVRFQFIVVAARRLEAYLAPTAAMDLDHRWQAVFGAPTSPWGVGVADVRDFLAHGPSVGSYVPA